MEAGTAQRVGAPGWLTGLAPLLILSAAIAAFLGFGSPGLDRNGPLVEELAIERTILRPGEIELKVRNDGPDHVKPRQVTVNDGFVPFTQSDDDLGRLQGSSIKFDYPWLEGEAYEIAILSDTGAKFAHGIDAAAETPENDADFFWLMALIGIYVGVIPVAIGMLWLPWLRQIDPRYIQFLLALTIGLLGFLGVDALLEGTELAGEGASAFGGSVLVWLGAAIAYLALVGIDGILRSRQEKAREAVASGSTLALLVAIGIGLHNLGEGLAIGSAYAIGSLALGAALIVGFALHNTTEGLAIVAPLGSGKPKLPRLLGLGLIAGAPAILGAVIGATAFQPGIAAFLFGLGAGAIAQVIVQIAPTVRDATGRLLHPLAVGGVLSGVVLMYTTGLLISL